MLAVLMSLRMSLRLAVSSALNQLSRVASGAAPRDQRGQTSAEYALVLLGAAAIALLIAAWATNSDLVGKLFNTVLESIAGKVK